MGGANNKRQQRARRRQRDAQLERARARFEAGDLSTCDTLCRALVKQNPQFIDARVMLARLAIRQGQIEDAVLILQQAVARDSSHADASYYLACAKFEQRSFPAALSASASALELAPQDPRIHHLRALIALAQGDAAAACTSGETACSLDVTHLDYTLTYCEALARASSGDAARDLLQARVLGRAIDSARSWQHVANIAELLGDTALATRGWAAVVKLDPSRIDHLYDAGCNQFTRGEFNRAAHSFRQCWRLAPRDRRVVNALLSSLRRLTPATTDAQLEAELVRCLAHEGIDPNHLRDIASRQLLLKPAMARILALPFTP